MPQAIDNTFIAALLNAFTPTGALGIPGTAVGTYLGTTAMHIRLNTTASTGAAAGTEIPTQTLGYTTASNGGWQALGQSTTFGGPPISVGVPFTTQSFVSAGGVVSSTGIVSFDLVSNSGVRGWFGLFNAQPIQVGSGNTFQVTGGAGAAAGITISLT
jgi:hypothetical protein